MRTARLALEWLVALAIGVAGLALLLNGSFFANYDALHIDLSINVVASHALRNGVNPYGETTLLELANSLGSPSILIYNQLFTSYIQPPTSALSLLPLTFFDWRDATHIYLYYNHVMLAAAIIVMLLTVRPTIPLRWVLAAVPVIVALYSQVYMSFSLGQIDATQTLLLTVAFWGMTTRRPAVAGTAVAIGAALKIVPGLLLVYFLWRREYKALAWGVGVGMVLLLLSLAYVGPDIYKTYLTETLPALLKGSTHYSNAAFSAILARANTPDWVGDLPEMLNLNEVTLSTTSRLIGLAFNLSALVVVALVLGRARPAVSKAAAPEPGSRLAEFYLVVAVGLTISSVTWDFYTIWLLPAFIATFLAPQRVLPGPNALRAVLLIGFAVAFVLINYPGDIYLFGPNDWFFHPEWVPGIWAEEKLQIYHKHLEMVLYIRLPALLLTSALFSSVVLLHRRVAKRAKPVPSEAPPSALPAPASS